jgi:catechol 2,3-dioxygenase-like lactoylglutathione lyase family enzyme
VTIQRMDNVGIVVDDIDAAVSFFEALGLELEGRATVEGPSVDRMVALDDVRCDIAMLRTPDGHSRIELAKYLNPVATKSGPPNPPHNTLGMYRVMFAVDDIDAAVAALRPHGAELVGEVAQYGDSYRICYLRGPDGIMVALAQEVG